MDIRIWSRILAIAGGSALGCAWACYFGTIDSVHFYNDFTSEHIHVDFGQLPQQMMPAGWNDIPRRGGTDAATDFAPDGHLDQVTPQEGYVDGYWGFRLTGSEDIEGDSPAARKARERLLARARNFEVQGKFKDAIHHYLSVWSESHAGFVYGRVNLLAASRGENSPALQSYLRITFVSAYYSRDNRDELRKLAQTHLPAYLKPIVSSSVSEPQVDARYEQAKSLIEENKIDEARRLFRKLLADQPNSPKRGPIYGWFGRCDYLQHRDAAAISCYRKQLSLDPTLHQRWMAHLSMATVYARMKRGDLQVEVLLDEWLNNPNAADHVSVGRLLRGTFPSLTAPQSKSLQKKLRKDSTLLSAYLGFRIEDTKLSVRQERSLFRFAYSALQSLYRQPPLLLIRIGQASYNAGLYKNAADLADQALARGSMPAELRHRALFLRAGSMARLGDNRGSMAAYRTLLAGHPRSYLATSAREHLALLEERHGDPVRALELYRQMGYHWDYAFLADAKLSLSDLQRAIDRTPVGEAKQVLRYTLAMRYLRQERYEDARQVWHRLGTLERYHFGLTPAHFKDFLKAHDNGNDFDDFPFLPDPLLTTDKLARWQKAAHSGPDDNRAKALYLAASYIYDHKTLLFYSAALWDFERAWALSSENWSKDINDQRDRLARRHHMYEHECYAQAMRYCRRIVEDYPNSSVTPQALYTGAIAAEHLANMSSSWREMDADAHYALSTHYLRQLARRYPNHPLARKAGKYAKVFEDERQQKRWQG